MTKRTGIAIRHYQIVFVQCGIMPISGMLMLLCMWSCNPFSARSRCSSQRTVDKGEWRKITMVHYGDLINSLSKRDLNPSAQSLFYSDSFIHVFENPYKYMEDAKKIMTDPYTSIQEKKIAIYSMQKMGLSNYLEWNNFMYRLYKNGKINHNELEISISGRSLVEYHILERSYKDKRVKAFFTLLISDSTLTNKEKYKKIVSGEIWKGLDRHMSDSYPCIYLIGDSLAKAKRRAQ